ncbi:MAG: hypothetical protein M3495_21615 [Pseudomonadota bacterium]|nr:hypothetical protein [Pseudomonadota bacterium]
MGDETNRASNQTTTIIVKRDTGNALGIASFIFGVLSIFILAPIFVPLALLIGVIAVIRKQLVWGILGLVCGLIGFMTSPILLALFGLATLGSIATVDRDNAQNTTAHVQPRELTEPISRTLVPTANMRSREASTTATLEIKNESAKHVRLFWIDYTGQEVFYHELSPGERYVQQTFVTHPWRIREATSGQLLTEMTVIKPHEVAAVR